MDKNDSESLLQTCKQMLANKNNIEDILLFLRQKDCSKVKSIKIVIDLLDVNLKEAKQLVHLSQAWKDKYKADEKFHNRLEESLDKLKKKDISKK